MLISEKAGKFRGAHGHLMSPEGLCHGVSEGNKCSGQKEWEGATRRRGTLCGKQSAIFSRAFRVVLNR